MKLPTILFLIAFSLHCSGQENYDLARKYFLENKVDSARYHIDKELQQRPTPDDYFLSGMIHEAEGKGLRALADYEAVVKSNPKNLEAHFQKGLIYFQSASAEKAIEDFTFVINNYPSSNTHAIYFGNDPFGRKETFTTTLQSMIGSVYQYRAQAHQKIGNDTKALSDFNKSFEFDTLADFYINRSHLFSKLGRNSAAIADLRQALKLESDSYLAWYNLALLDEGTRLPDVLLNDDEFTPMLNLLGANAYEAGDYPSSVRYLDKAISVDSKNELARLNRGKSLLRIKRYPEARTDFLKALQVNARNYEAFYLIGNSFFYEKNYKDAIGFYERYLSVDQGHKNVWYNAAMAYLSSGQPERACQCLERANEFGMEQAAAQMKKHCESP